MANLRIVSKNQVTAVSGSTTGADAANDYKSQFQTVNASPATVTVTTTSITGAVAIIAVLAEDVGSVTMTCTTTVTESTTSSINTTPGIQYGGVKYVALYTTLNSGTQSFAISFNKTVKVSRFIIGNYWSPTHNMGYGISVGYTDSSTVERLQTGDQYIVALPRHKTMQFELQYLNETDKFTMFDIARVCGKVTPVFVSAFPGDTYQDKEQMYSIYGRFNTPANIAHSTFTMYSSSLQLEEF